MFLVVGANGQLGNELRVLLSEKAVYVDREELDITNEQAVKEFFAKQQFDFVVNAAAYTAVDKAEEEAEVAALINVDGVRNLAKYGKKIIHVSTDYVFDGTGYQPYKETDKVAPLGVYGKTKLAGEQAALKEAETAIVIRTAWLYSIYGKNFVKTMCVLGQTKEQLKVVFDQVGSPTWAHDLAKAIVSILPQVKSGSKEIYHFSNEGVCSWYDFARTIMVKSHLNCRVVPIESCEYPTKAQRPHYSVLNKAKIKQDFNLTIPHWEESLEQCLKQL